MNMFRKLRTTALVTLLCGVIAAPAMAQTETFGTYRGGMDHTGFVDTQINANLALLWQFTKTNYHGNTSSPVVTGHAVVFGLGKHVYAVSVKTGALMWQYPAADDDSGPLYDCPPAYADGKVFIGNDNGTFYALDARTGNVAWQFKTDAFIHTAPVVDDGIVYFSSGASLYALDDNTAKPEWPVPLKTATAIISTAVVENDNVYVVDGSGTLYSFSINSGRSNWTTQVSGSPISAGALVYTHNTLLFRDGSMVKSISARGGDALGEIQMDADVVGPITVTDDGSFIISTGDLQITSLDTHGRKLWSSPAKIDDFISSPMLATSTEIFVGSNSGVIYAINRQTGAIDWDYTVLPVSSKSGVAPPKTAPIFAAPVVANGTLYVLSDDGTLSAFRQSAPDNVQPVITALYPAPDSTINGKAIPYQVTVNDVGSGVKPSSVSLIVDGKSIPVRYDLNSTKIVVQDQPSMGGVPVALDTLDDGTHKAMVTVFDWRGNRLMHAWTFKVDSTKNAVAASTPPVPLDQPLGGGNGSQMPNTNAVGPAGGEAQPMTGSPAQGSIAPAQQSRTNGQATTMAGANPGPEQNGGQTVQAGAPATNTPPAAPAPTGIKVPVPAGMAAPPPPPPI